MFSIILPTYNNKELFARAIQSVLCQQGEYHIIVVDDSTNNDIEDYVASLDHTSITYIHNKPSLGAVKNWNSGLQLAQGDYIIIMHHDEAFATKDHLVKIQSQMESGADVVLSRIQVSLTNGKTYGLYNKFIKQLMLRHPCLCIAINSFGPCACIAFRRCDTLFNEDMRWFVDVEWYYRILRNRHAVYLPDTVIDSHHGSEGQITQNINPMKVAKADFTAIVNKYGVASWPAVMAWIHIYVIHNIFLNNTIKRILGR